MPQTGTSNSVIYPVDLSDVLQTTQAYKATLKQYGAKKKYWDNSPYEHLNLLPPASKGAVFANFVEDLAKQQFNLLVGPSLIGSDADRTVAGTPTEIKGSMCWGIAHPGKWVWEQIRPSQKWQRLIILGINPSAVYMWWCEKTDLDANGFLVGAHKQHGGRVDFTQADRFSYTYWMKTASIKDVPSYMKDLGSW